MPLVTRPRLSQRLVGRGARTASSIAIAVGLIATACTSSDGTEATLTNLDNLQTTAVTSTVQPSSGSNDLSDNHQRYDPLAFDGGHFSNDSASFVEEPVDDEPYWTGTSTTTNQPPSTASPTAKNPTASARKASPPKESVETKQAPKKSAPVDPGYTRPEQALVATAIGDGVSSFLSDEPGPAQHWFPNPTQFGNERVFQVLDNESSADYIKISLPVKPNGQEGWIPRDTVTISEVHHFAVIDLGSDSLTVWDGEEVIVQTKAVTGRPSRPTPIGQFFVRDIIKRDNPGGAYGPYIVALSGFSEVLETFGGGLPAIAIHGTNKPWLVGGEHSSGCIRIPNDLIQLLAASVPPGTPVNITA